MRMVRHWALHCILTTVLLCVWLPVGSGCRSAQTDEPPPTPTDVPAIVETIAPTPAVTATPLPGAPQTITIWAPELLAPLDPDDSAVILEQQILAFEATHPGLTIEVLPKKTEGKGGLADLILSASTVAPDVIPDLIAIDMDRLSDMARQDLLVPLDGLIEPDLVQDLYSFAVQAGTVDGQLVGVPFEVSIEHALYNTAKIAVPPASWEEVFASGATYIFPTLGQDEMVNDAFLIQYLSTGAELLDPNGEPSLDQQALVDVLTFYRDGIENGAILTDVLEYDSVRSGWRKYLQAEVVLSNMTSNLYLEGRGLLKVSKASWIPTRDGETPVTLARGTAWAMTTHAPYRHELTAKLLSWLLNPSNMATWSLAAERLPTRRAAFEQMPRDDDEYVGFVYGQLEYAIAYPTTEAHKRVYRAMQQAVDAVLREGETPVAAAAGVLQVLGQEVGP
jgi:ABC-type glycerol-3-phosphate transport system substrate-binding protein